MTKLEVFERLGRDDGDVGVRQARRTQIVDGLLRRGGIGVEAVDRAHAPASGATLAAEWAGVACPCGAVNSPAFSSQIEMIGTNFENSAYSNTIPANVAAMIVSSTGRGPYSPHE